MKNFFTPWINFAAEYLTDVISGDSKKKELEISKKKSDDIQKRVYISECLRELTQSFEKRDAILDNSLRILFENNLYAECVLEIMRKMGLSNTVKVTAYSDSKYPRLDHSAAFISLPVNNIPPIDSTEFTQLRIPIGIKLSAVKKFETFVYIIAHELSHLVLHGANNSLKGSEVATDLFVIVSGFGHIMGSGIQGRTTKYFDSHNKGYHTEYRHYGYLTLEEVVFAQNYLNKLV